jgi:RNA polymerase sigma-70 factor (ECF subfamily)
LTEQKNYTEKELVISLKLRNNDAYRYLYLNYRGSLFSIINQIVPDAETANDVLQEAFITIWSQIDKYNPEKGRLFTWLLNVTRNTAINKLRSKNYKNSLKNEDISNYVNSTDNKNTVSLNINQIGLRKEIHKLKDDYKLVIELCYFNGFTQDEISKALNIPLGTVKTRLRAALLELKKQFV